MEKRDAKTLAKIAAEIDEQIDNAGNDISPFLAKKATIIIGTAGMVTETEFTAQRVKKYNKAISKALYSKDLSEEELLELATGKLRRRFWSYPFCEADL